MILYVSCTVTEITHIQHQITHIQHQMPTIYIKSAINRHTQGDIKIKEYKIVFIFILYLYLSLFKTLYMKFGYINFKAPYSNVSLRMATDR